MVKVFTSISFHKSKFSFCDSQKSCEKADISENFHRKMLLMSKVGLWTITDISDIARLQLSILLLLPELCLLIQLKFLRGLMLLSSLNAMQSAYTHRPCVLFNLKQTVLYAFSSNVYSYAWPILFHKGLLNVHHWTFLNLAALYHSSFLNSAQVLPMVIFSYYFYHSYEYVLVIV